MYEDHHDLHLLISLYEAYRIHKYTNEPFVCYFDNKLGPRFNEIVFKEFLSKHEDITSLYVYDLDELKKLELPTIRELVVWERVRAQTLEKYLYTNKNHIKSISILNLTEIENYSVSRREDFMLALSNLERIEIFDIEKVFKGLEFVDFEISSEYMVQRMRNFSSKIRCLNVTKENLELAKRYKINNIEKFISKGDDLILLTEEQRKKTKSIVLCISKQHKENHLDGFILNFNFHNLISLVITGCSSFVFGAHFIDKLEKLDIDFKFFLNNYDQIKKLKSLQCLKVFDCSFWHFKKLLSIQSTMIALHFKGDHPFDLDKLEQYDRDFLYHSEILYYKKSFTIDFDKIYYYDLFINFN